jgi:Na+/phosphate symporter
MSPLRIVAGVVGIFASLYVFLIGLGLMGDGFKCVGGRGAANMFAGVSKTKK